MRRIYPWEQWFSEERTVILRGVHYRCSQSTMVQTIRNNISQRGLSGRVRVIDTNTEIIIEVKHGLPQRLVRDHTEQRTDNGIPNNTTELFREEVSVISS